ncbi:hypothetical protein E2R51_09300 [Jeotgalibacillus sp. S-D1]|uniref:hypothetical protein n=1 Tax=Jeotgalibacillus sp. S-D1 TaxID=2552189 RepID=UPI00105A082F|nr:hypothetical protein [Jeotgalibacillus sp. S-D1]TDL32854.1 hypothetical protein E2R51_09300 [Jeotgalibacillus sp. S-D1]
MFDPGNVEVWMGNVEAAPRSVEGMVCGVEGRARAVEVHELNVEPQLPPAPNERTKKTCNE